MKSTAVVFNNPKQLSLQSLELPELQAGQVEVAVQFSGISTGTERMLWDGSMPAFPGLGYPLVPGDETVARVIRNGPGCQLDIGQRVFVPGSSCFQGVKSLFGGAASRLVVAQNRVAVAQDHLPERAVLLALASTAKANDFLASMYFLDDMYKRPNCKCATSKLVSKPMAVL